MVKYGFCFIVGPGGAADEEKQNQQGNHEDKETLNDRFQEKFTHPKKLSPGDSYNVENLTITVKDPCDQSQHSVTKKGEEIKLKVCDKWRTSLYRCANILSVKFVIAFL